MIGTGLRSIARRGTVEPPGQRTTMPRIRRSKPGVPPSEFAVGVLADDPRAWTSKPSWRKRIADGVAHRWLVVCGSGILSWLIRATVLTLGAVRQVGRPWVWL